MTAHAEDASPTPETEPAPLARSIDFGREATNWDHAYRIARMLAQSALVPKGYQGHPEDCVVAMQYGAEVGLAPMAALQSIAVINGKPGLYGDGFLGVLLASPLYVRHREYYELGDGTIVDRLTPGDLNADLTTAVCQFWRRGNPEPFVGTFSIAEAKRAKLWTKDGPWTQYPARQLRWRARGFAGRDAFPDVLRGLKIDAELFDLGDVGDEPAPIVPPVRRSQKRTDDDENRIHFADAPAVDSRQPPPPPASDPPEPDVTPSRRRASSPAPVSAPASGSGGKANGDTSATGVIITDTAYVKNDADEYYEVRARVDEPGRAPIAYVLLTRDKGLYDLAASAEGSPQHFAIAWHTGKRPDGSPCKVLDSIVASA